MLYKKLNNLEERKNLPLNGPSNYRVEDQIIYTKAMEINATMHCNLSCKGCSHSAPIMSKHEYDLNQLKKDLEKLSKYIRCDIIRIVGGEPLLHSNLKELVRIIKESKISNKISLITNGVLLPEIDLSILEDINELEVSLYPLKEELRKKITDYVSKIKDHFSKVRILEYDSFRIPFVKEKSNNEKLVKQVYETCQIAHYWRCITIENGYLYRCPQSMIQSVKEQDYKDGLPIPEIKDYKEVLEFLENNHPIGYCSRCLGSVGSLIQHKQVNKKEWEESIPSTLEEAVDESYVEEINKQFNTDMKCMVRKKV